MFDEYKRTAIFDARKLSVNAHTIRIESEYHYATPAQPVEKVGERNADTQTT